MSSGFGGPSDCIMVVRTSALCIFMTFITYFLFRPVDVVRFCYTEVFTIQTLSLFFSVTLCVQRALCALTLYSNKKTAILFVQKQRSLVVNNICDRRKQSASSVGKVDRDGEKWKFLWDAISFIFLLLDVSFGMSKFELERQRFVDWSLKWVSCESHLNILKECSLCVPKVFIIYRNK